MANFTWIISQLECIPQVGNLQKVITNIHYRAVKTASGFTVDHYNMLEVPAPHEASFTPYEDVTQAIVEGWLEAALDCEEIEAILDGKIDAYVNPPKVAYPLPWEQPSILP